MAEGEAALAGASHAFTLDASDDEGNGGTSGGRVLAAAVPGGATVIAVCVICDDTSDKVRDMT